MYYGALVLTMSIWFLLYDVCNMPVTRKVSVNRGGLHTVYPKGGAHEETQCPLERLGRTLGTKGLMKMKKNTGIQGKTWTRQDTLYCIE